MGTIFYNASGILNAVMTLFLLVGGYIALRNGDHQKAGEIQEQVISALKAELETLQRRIEALEKENIRLNHILGLIKSALRKRGLTISINGDLLTIDDSQGNSQYGQIRDKE